MGKFKPQGGNLKGGSGLSKITGDNTMGVRRT
jgi:hypothetical protein